MGSLHKGIRVSAKGVRLHWALTSSNSPNQWHQDELDRIIPWPDDQHHAIGILADEGCV